MDQGGACSTAYRHRPLRVEGGLGTTGNRICLLGPHADLRGDHSPVQRASKSVYRAVELLAGTYPHGAGDRHRLSDGGSFMNRPSDEGMPTEFDLAITRDTDF